MINTIKYYDCTIKNNIMTKKYKLLNQNGYLDDILTNTYNIKFNDVYYLGVFQGQKIYINNKKYPLKHGHFYTSNNLNKNILNALNEKNKKVIK
tara:strand:- start:180 stop:461 length:282 start_codon:yes stop_codon:yes gene_type:complete